MHNKLQFHRAMLLLGLLGAAFAGLGYRLVDLQVVRHDELSVKAQQNTQREIRQQPRRGDILDVNGNILATSVPVNIVCADPSLIGTQALAVAHVIAPLLELNEAAIAQRLARQTYVTNNSAGATVTNHVHYVRLARNVTDPIWQRVYAAMTNFTYDTGGRKLSRQEAKFLTDLRQEAIHAESDQLRVYPNGALACQVIGFPGTVEETNLDGHVVSKIVGRDGIEKALQEKLSGVAGWRVTETDKEHREVVSLRDEDVYARDGFDVVLTIDSEVQHIVETVLSEALREHAPQSITGIVMRPRTGEILALASLPNFDANQPRTITPDTHNRVIQDIIEPGSTFKIVVVSGALNGGVVKLTDEFYCEHGRFRYAGKWLRDHEPLDMLTTEAIITKSSNIGAAKIGIKLGADSLYKYAWDFGFGQRTGIPLPGEVPGILHPVKQWSGVSIAQIPMGQGVAVTRLQMLYAMAAIANGGCLMQPMIVSRLREHNGSIVEQYAPKRVRQVITEATSKEMVQALKTVVSKEGTAPEAAMKYYLVAGKTGTAQKPEKGGYASDKFISSFIGFFPADDPEICISVVMDEPKEGYYGGKVCGPVFRDIAERCASYLNIPPDLNLTATNTPPLVAGAGSQK